MGLAGYGYLQNYYLSSLERTNPQLQHQFYESGWRLGKWDLDEPNDEEKNFSFHHYAALKNLHESHFDGARIHVMNARRRLIPLVSGICLESTKNLYHILSKVQCLQVNSSIFFFTFSRACYPYLFG